MVSIESDDDAISTRGSSFCRLELETPKVGEVLSFLT